MSNCKSVLIFGASGITGAAIAHKIKSDYDITGTYFNNDYDVGVRMMRVNLANKEEIEDIFKKIKPDIVVNCAGATSIPDCEKNPEEAYLLNVNAVENICKLVSKSKIKGVFLSTDSIFSGEKYKRILQVYFCSN